MTNVWRTLIGKPLATADLAHQAVNRFIGLAVFASDALSSTAYATEEILVILAFASTAYLNLSIPIAICIAILLTIVTVSYRQTIFAYPNGGGAYIVARDNLGELPAQVAGAALLTDYILTVAVSISSGVAQIASASPWVAQNRVAVAIFVIIFMTIMNLRGVKESGRIFAIPTYFFLSMAFLLLGTGLYRYFSGNLGTLQACKEGAEAIKGCVEVIHHEFIEPLTLFLILRAFSSGCTALTGIEAISNGITAFKDPKSKNAAATLTYMSVILITIFVGFTLLANQIGALPSHKETVISQMARAVYGDGSILYFMALAGTALILLMAANTSYADFPRLAALHAGDGFLPRQLTQRGARLVYSVGIMTLGFFAGMLVIIFNAQTSALIPLYAIGVFLSFTMSQSGMVVRALKMGRLKPGETLTTENGYVLEHERNWRLHLAISGVGALATFVVMCVFAITKFTTGAWFIIVLVPALVFAFFRIHHHYKAVAQILSSSGKRLDKRKHLVSSVVLVDNVHAGTLRLVEYAKSTGVPWKALHVAVDDRRAADVKKKWQERIGEGELVMMTSPFRQIIEPIRQYVQAEIDKAPDGYVNVILGHLVMDTAWEQALHQNSAYIFTLGLQNLDHVVVTTVPFQLHRLKHSADEDGEDEDKPAEVKPAPAH
jgi:amino acid transporter